MFDACNRPIDVRLKHGDGSLDARGDLSDSNDDGTVLGDDTILGDAGRDETLDA